MLVASHPLKPHRVPKLLPGTVQHSKMNQTFACSANTCARSSTHADTFGGIDQHWQTQWPQSKNSVNRLITESFLAAGSPCCWKDFCRSKVKINLLYLPDGWNMVQQADCSDQPRAEAEKSFREKHYRVFSMFLVIFPFVSLVTNRVWLNVTHCDKNLHVKKGDDRKKLQGMKVYQDK